jgi:outer membrane protein TolC
VEGTHSSVTVGIRLPFGTQDRNRPLEASAIGDLDVAQSAEQRLRERLQADAEAARAALASAEQQLAVEQERAKLLRERRELIDRSFRAGETGLPDLLRATASASQAQAIAVRQDIYVARARARLQQAIGIQP